MIFYSLYFDLDRDILCSNEIQYLLFFFTLKFIHDGFKQYKCRY